MRALGISRPRILVGTSGEPWRLDVRGEPAVVEGVDGEWRVDAEVLEAVRAEGSSAGPPLLSPFDRPGARPDRLLACSTLDYAVEMFKPAAKRQFGYFALPRPARRPVRGAARRESRPQGRPAARQRRARELPFDDEVGAAVDEQIRAMARWLRLGRRPVTVPAPLVTR
jgi:uncharacterized protein YcaQ